MKVISEKKVTIIKIEYEASKAKDERAEVFDWLDKTYGELKWRSVRSGPLLNETDKGLVIVEVEI